MSRLLQVMVHHGSAGRGAAQVGGSLIGLSYGGVGVSQGASMYAHRLDKAPGADLTITARWAALTKDHAGVGIRWRYRIHWVIWNRTPEPNVNLYNDYSTGEIADFNQQMVTPLHFIIPAGTPDGAVLSVSADLQALKSDSTGNSIPDDWIQLVNAAGDPIRMIHHEAVVVNTGGGPGPGGPVIPSGAISTIDVT